MKKKALKDYLINSQIDIDQVIDEYYGCIYGVVKNSISIAITEEDIEEMVSDVFVALWKNYEHLKEDLEIKPYLIGISKNIIKNRYRKAKIDVPITDFEDKLISNYNVEKTTESIECEREINTILKSLQEKEYKVFILYYYESKTIKEVAFLLNISINNVKVILHRVRKIIGKKLEDGGYGYGK